jgi:hypothetical protein
MTQKKVNKLYTPMPIDDESYYIVQMPITKITSRSIHCDHYIFNKKTLIDNKRKIRAFTSKELLIKKVNELILSNKTQKP